MNADRDQRVMDLLAELLDLPKGDRAPFLERACAGDVALRSEVESLAGAYDRGDDFFAGADEAAEPPDFPIGDAAGTQIGRYTIVERIGEGGFGAVYLAEQHHPVKRRVALKLIKEGMDTRRVIARFNAERQALAMMDHPNIAKVLEAGATDAGRPYFVMELVQGVPITRYCQDHQLPIKQRLQLFMQVCQAVQHAHQKGIIHRDLKPTNILVSEQDGKPVPKVIDFGIAKATQGRLTEQSFSTDQAHWLGTPQYMSPEQADGSADIDTRTDVYSLGVILYELLCGYAPFGFKSSGYSEIQRTIREVDPPPPSTKAIHRELRGDLDRIVLKAIEKDRGRRYETASALSADIQRYLNNEPVTARQPTAFYMLGKLVRRNRLNFGVTAAISITLSASTFASVWLLRAKAAERVQRTLREEAAAKQYASDMEAAQQAVEASNFAAARALLDQHRPRPGEPDRRGWEWRYLWQQSRSDATAVLFRRPRGILSLAVSPHDQWIAVGEREGGGLTIYEMKTGKQLPHPYAGQMGVRVAFSPSEALLAFTALAADAQGRVQETVHLWDMKTSIVIATAKLNDFSQGLAFLADGNTLLVSTARGHTGLGPSDHGEISLFRVPTLATDRRVPAPDAHNHFAVSPDLSLAVVTSGDQICAIDLVTGKERRTARIASGGVTALAFSPDGRRLAVSAGTSDAAIHFLDPRSGHELGTALTGHTAWVGALCFLNGGKTLASAGGDQVVRLWDVSDPANGRPLGRPLRAYSEVWALALLPDGKTLVSGGKDGSVCLWDTSKPRYDLSPQKLKVKGWDFGNEGSSLVTVDLAGHVDRRQGPDFQQVQRILDIDPKKGVGWAYVCDHGRRLNLHFTDGSCEFWDLESVHRLHPHPKGWADGAVVTPERYFLLYYEKDNEAVVWDPVNAREVGAPWHPSGRLDSYAATPDRRWRVVLGYGGSGTILDADTGQSKALDLDVRELGQAFFSPDGSLLAGVSEYGFVGLWKATDLTRGGKVPPVARFGVFALAPDSLAFSPDGRRLAVGSTAKEAVRVFDVAGRLDLLTLAGRDSGFFETKFSLDGSTVASRNREFELYLWHAPSQAEIDAAEANERIRNSPQASEPGP